MKNFKNKKTLQIVLLVVIAVVTLGIGYAAISAVNLIINGNATARVDQNNFKVHFTQAQSIAGSTGVSGTSNIDSQDDTKAMFDVTGLTKIGDYAEAVYTVRNDSNGIGAEITLNLNSSNTEYFKVTETILDDKLQAGEETTAKVRVEMIKTPVADAVSTSITATLTAGPLEDAEAIGGEEKSKVKPGTFAGDSWAEIAENVKNNTTEDYHIGDTKVVTINNIDYQVRIANKSTYDWCEDERYSQTACGFVVEFADIIEKMMMKNSHTNEGGYPNTLIYSYLRDTLYGQLPSDLQAAIKPTRVISGHGKSDSTNFTTTDNLYLLSGVEVFESDSYDTAASTTTQLDYYRGMEGTEVTDPYPHTVYTRSYKRFNENEDSIWWLRTHVSTGTTSFLSVGSGNLRSDMANGASCQGGAGISPAFRIG